MIRNIIQIGNDILYKKSEKVAEEEILSRENQELIDDMLDTCEAEKDSTAGLSAVQVGVLKRIMIIKKISDEEHFDEGEWEVCINPQIEILDTTPHFAWEGCLSVGERDSRLFAPVSRPNKVKLTYKNREGEDKKIEATAYFSHIVQHEIDHLNGILFLKHVHNPKNIWRNDKLDEYLDKYGTYPEIR